MRNVLTLTEIDGRSCQHIIRRQKVDCARLLEAVQFCTFHRKFKKANKLNILLWVSNQSHQNHITWTFSHISYFVHFWGEYSELKLEKNCLHELIHRCKDQSHHRRFFFRIQNCFVKVNSILINMNKIVFEHDYMYRLLV